MGLWWTNRALPHNVQGSKLEIDDILLLESFQISYLPSWVPEKEFAAILIARPEIKSQERKSPDF